MTDQPVGEYPDVVAARREQIEHRERLIRELEWRCAVLDDANASLRAEIFTLRAKLENVLEKAVTG
jgi:hypothetical protein